MRCEGLGEDDLMPLLKLLNKENHVLAIVCDKELLGKELRQGEFRLKIDEGFYGGKDASVEECLAALRRVTMANLVGSIVERAVRAGLVDEKDVLNIQGVPHAQFVRL